MNSLVSIIAGEPRTTTEAIARYTENDHASTIKLVRTYQQDFEQFGRVGFEIQPFATPGGQQTRQVANLNEDQAILLLTYMRNSEIVRSFKVALVKAFGELRRSSATGQFQVPTTLSGALRLAAEQAEQIEQQQLLIEQQRPAVEFVEKFVQLEEGDKGFREVCKILKANESRFREFLLGESIMYRLGGKLMAYQPHINAGRFRVTTGMCHQEKIQVTNCKMTAKGVKWIAGEWAKYQLGKSDTTQ